jgi:hypothetical protein
VNLKIIITAPARLEIAEAIKYYEERRPSAGRDEFARGFPRQEACCWRSNLGGLMKP